MKIETKYNIGDTFWKMHDNKVQSFIVRQIHVQVTKDGMFSSPRVRSLYFDRYGTDWIRCYDEDIFSTKEALLASL